MTGDPSETPLRRPGRDKAAFEDSPDGPPEQLGLSKPRLASKYGPAETLKHTLDEYLPRGRPEHEQAAAARPLQSGSASPAAQGRPARPADLPSGSPLTSSLSHELPRSPPVAIPPPFDDDALVASSPLKPPPLTPQSTARSARGRSRNGRSCNTISGSVASPCAVAEGVGSSSHSSQNPAVSAGTGSAMFRSSTLVSEESMESGTATVASRLPELPMRLKLLLPDGSPSSLMGVPAEATVWAVKRQIEVEHGIRASSIRLRFFGQELENAWSLVDCGVADGGLLKVQLQPLGRTRRAAEPSPSESSPPTLSAGSGAGPPAQQAPPVGDDAGDPAGAASRCSAAAARDSRRAHEALPASSVGGACLGGAPASPRPTLPEPPPPVAVALAAGYGKRSDAWGLQESSPRGRTSQALRADAPPMSFLQQSAGMGAGLGDEGSASARSGSQAGFATLHGSRRSSRDVEDRYRVDLARPIPDKGRVGTAPTAEVQKPEWSFASSPTGAPPHRAELVAEVFCVLDADGDGRLNFRELRRFAGETGFTGTDEEWASEYASLCKDAGLAVGEGLDHAAFARLVDDPSADGCYCREDELQGILAKFCQDGLAQEKSRKNSKIPRELATPPPPPVTVAKEVDAASQSSSAPSASSSKGFEAIFGACDLNRDGHLNSEELAMFARRTGWSDTTTPWEEQYAKICAQVKAPHDVGIDFSRLCALVFDAIGDVGVARGGSCSDDESEEISATPVASARGGVGVETVASPRVPTSSACPPQADAVPAPAASMTRAVLLRAVFHSCDTNGDGCLSIWEAYIFASCTGFKGSDEEWEEEYRLLCIDIAIDPAVGLTFSQFEQLVGEGKAGGLFCSDKELLEVHEQLMAGGAASLRKATAGIPSIREGLIRQVFIAVDFDGDGYLNSREMRHFATFTGFDGDKEAWAHEYQLLCADHGVDRDVGLDLHTFEKIVNDATTKGCYCTPQELKSMLAKLGDKSKGAHEACSGQQVETTAVARKAANKIRKAPTQPSSRNLDQVVEPKVQVCLQSASPIQVSRPRREAISRLFLMLDKDQDGALNEEELQYFARLTGFSGTAEEWAAEHRQLCLDRGAKPSIGLTCLHFKEFVNDRSKTGCYFSDQELELLLERLESDARARLVKPLVEEFHRGPTERSTASGRAAAQERAAAAERAGIPAAFAAALELEAARHRAAASRRPPREEQPPRGDEAASTASEDAPVHAEDLKREKVSSLLTDTGLLIEAQPPHGEAPAQLATPPAPDLDDIDESRQRQDLVEQVFSLCDGDGDGFLNVDEMWRFASAFGLAVEKEMWPEEWEALCSHYVVSPDVGIDRGIFWALVNEPEPGACSCTDEELRKAVQLLSGGPLAATSAKGPSEESSPAPAAGSRPPAEPPLGSLGTPQELGSPRELGPPLQPCSLVDLGPPRELELPRDLSPLREAGLPQGPSVVAPAGAADAAAVSGVDLALSEIQSGPGNGGDACTISEADIRDMSRAELVNVIFHTCDEDGDGLLCERELHVFACLTGFNGSRDAWSAEFQLLCADNGVDPSVGGVSMSLFERLVDDTSERGCYCVDVELRSMLSLLQEARRQWAHD